MDVEVGSAVDDFVVVVVVVIVRRRRRRCRHRRCGIFSCVLFR